MRIRLHNNDFLNPASDQAPLVLADSEHYSEEAKFYRIG